MIIIKVEKGTNRNALITVELALPVRWADCMGDYSKIE
jgi:hypothetical protein